MYLVNIGWFLLLFVAVLRSSRNTKILKIENQIIQTFINSGQQTAPRQRLQISCDFTSATQMLLVPPPSPPSFPAVNFTSGRHSRLSILPRRVVAAPAAATNEVDAFTQYSGYLFDLSSSEAESLNEYNISKIAGIYQKKPLILLRRLLQTASTLGRWFALRYYDRITERADVMFEVRIMTLNL